MKKAALLGGGSLLILVVLVVVLQALGFHGLRHDDAYISFRYSANLASGNGLVFNPGERLMGSTSPGHALLGALIYPLVGHARFPAAMSVLGCVAWTLQAVAVYAILVRPLDRAAAAFVALAIVAGAAWSHRFLALETNLVAAAVLWAMAAAFRGRWYASAVACAVAGILRPDAYVLVVPLGLLCLHELRLRAWRPLALGAALTAPWYVFAYAYFGTVLPQSAPVKVGAESVAKYASTALPYVTANLALPVIQYGTAGAGSWLLAAVVAAASLAGAVVLARRSPKLLVLPVHAASLLAAYLIMRPQPGLEWHLYPVLLTAALLVLSLLAALGQRLVPRLGRAPVLAAAAALLCAFTVRTVRYAGFQEHAYWYGARDAVYRDIAAHVRARSESGDWITSIEVGTLAYYTGLPVMDQAGLITREPKGLVGTRRYRWLVDVPAYPPYYDAERASPPFATFASEPIAREELHIAGEERFIAVVEDRPRRGQ